MRFFVEQKCCSCTPYQQHDEKGEFSAWNSHLLCPSVPYLGVETTFTRHSRWVVKSEDSRSRDIYTWKHTDFSLLKTTSLEIKLVRWRKPKISVNSCDIVENWWRQNMWSSYQNSDWLLCVVDLTHNGNHHDHHYYTFFVSSE